MWRDLERLCEAAELPFRRPALFPRNGLLAARVTCRFGKEKWTPNFVRAVFHANFAEDQDIADPKMIAACLSSAGQDAAAILQAAAAEDAKAMLHEQTERSVRLGVFGAPSFVVGDELFWGNDRFEQALKWYKSHKAVI
jgi:2-hydroxychromene-2-carboxylate isomerase